MRRLCRSVQIRYCTSNALQQQQNATFTPAPAVVPIPIPAAQTPTIVPTLTAV
ncbi:9073_t:CDS:2 [Entrophospora sp. SA101]|nr:9073_t:CDS:2 [Entrophospora sp. SA101]CAJ0826140.1 20123_t:CDS:2 [Entrophospora sp. SA101]